MIEKADWVKVVRGFYDWRVLLYEHLRDLSGSDLEMLRMDSLQVVARIHEVERERGLTVRVKQGRGEDG